MSKPSETTPFRLLPAHLSAWLMEAGEPTYRARQIGHWIYRKLVFDPSQMTNLPAALRASLGGLRGVLPVWPEAEVSSGSGLTRKALLRLEDGDVVEAVLMVYPARGSGRTRRTVCVSSQAGCAIGCPFCVTGAAGFRRNLTADEIVGQVLYFARRVRDLEGRDADITNVVLMGQGEPLANLWEVWRAVEILNCPEGFGLGARHVTISTAGLAPGIRRLARLPLQIGLAVSLHAPDDALRDRLVPVNRRYPIAELLDACREYARQTNRRVSFEYVMISGVNDSPEQADVLAALLSDLLSHVNLIPLNRVDGSSFQPSPRSRILAFQARLRRHGLACSIRAGRGDEIDAACGQLRARRPRPPSVEEERPYGGRQAS